jgi:hypothetical protein
LTGGEVAAVVAAVTGVVSVALLLTLLLSTTRALTALQHHVDELRRQPVRVVHAERVEAAVVDPDGRDGRTPEGARSRPAPRLAAVAFSDPVIKAVAFASGTRRAARTLRHERRAR